MKKKQKFSYYMKRQSADFIVQRPGLQTSRNEGMLKEHLLRVFLSRSLIWCCKSTLDTCSNSYIRGKRKEILRSNFHLCSKLLHGEYEWQDAKSEDDIVTVIYIDKNGNKKTIKGKVGDNLMYLAHRHEIEMEGACEASLACTTCHCYVKGDFLTKLPSPEEKEEDLLDLAPFLKENSRLGCQIILSKDLDGIEVHLPKATRNFYVDGHKPKPH